MSKHKNSNKKRIPAGPYLILGINHLKARDLYQTFVEIKKYESSIELVLDTIFIIRFYTYRINVRIGEVIDIHKSQFKWVRGNIFEPTDSTISFRRFQSHPIGNPTNSSLQIDSLTQSKNILPNHSLYQLSWDNVTFKNGHILFSSPYQKDGGKGLQVSWDKCSSDFIKIKPALIKMIPDIYAEIKQGNITNIRNIKHIKQSIINVSPKSFSHSNISRHKTNLKISCNPIKMRLEDVQSMPIIKSSKYLNTLCDIHIKYFPIYYCIETNYTISGNIAHEKAFIFIIKKTDSAFTIIYENTLESRSSYIFLIRAGGFIGTIKKICNYFSSETENKRQCMAYNTVKFPADKVFSYHRIIHKSLSQWHEDLNTYLK